jgi:hypothetical protein
MPSLLISNEKIKDPEKVADVLNSSFLWVAENLNLHQVGKDDPISFLKDAFLANWMVLKLSQLLRLRWKV